MERRKSTVNAPKTGARGAEAEARRMHLGLKPKAACAGTYWGAVMQCLACRADNKMLLMDVLHHARGTERRTSPPHFSQR
jgi:hypothetical protein